MATAREFLDVELKDNNSPYGGVAFMGETLRDFIESDGDVCEINEDSDMEDVNQILNECGIKVIPYDGMVFKGRYTYEEIDEAVNNESEHGNDIIPYGDYSCLAEYIRNQTREKSLYDLIDEWCNN